MIWFCVLSYIVYLQSSIASMLSTSALLHICTCTRDRVGLNWYVSYALWREISVNKSGEDLPMTLYISLLPSMQEYTFDFIKHGELCFYLFLFLILVNIYHSVQNRVILLFQGIHLFSHIAENSRLLFQYLVIWLE